MKTQAWGWLIAGVVALGLNGFYHDGGATWARQTLGQTLARISHQTEGVLALAVGRADLFAAKAAAKTEDIAVRNETSSCRFASAMARVQSRVAHVRSRFANFEAMNAQREARFAQAEATRAKMQAQFARLRFTPVDLKPADLMPADLNWTDFNESCPRVRVRVPHVPRVRVPSVDVHVEVPAAGPV